FGAARRIARCASSCTRPGHHERHVARQRSDSRSPAPRSKNGERMSYIDKPLHPGERVIHLTRVHWIIVAQPLRVMLVTLGSAGALAETQYSQLAALFFVIFVLPYAGSVALTYYFAEIAVTTQRLVAR